MVLKGIYACSTYNWLRFATQWNGRSFEELPPVDSEWFRVNDRIVFPEHVPIGWHFFPSQNTDAAWREWFAYLTKHVGEGDDRNAAAHDGCVWHPIVEQALFVVDEWAGRGDDLKLTPLAVKRSVRGLTVLDAIREIKRMLFGIKQLATVARENGEGASKKKGKRRQRGRRRGNYDESLHQKVYVAYIAMTPGKASAAARTAAYDTVASRTGVSPDEARLIVKRLRARDDRKAKNQNRQKRKTK
jgi:hypothetical protein